MMIEWLARMTESLAFAARGMSETFRELEWAREHGARVELEPLRPSAGRGQEPQVMATTIEQIRPDDVVIAQPMTGGYVHMLTTGERFLMRWQSARGRVTATTRTLGRIRIREEGSGVFYGYRIALPDNLRVQDMRANQRVPIGIDLAPRVDLQPLPLREGPPVRGTGQDLSTGGMLVRAIGRADRLRIRQRAMLSVELPEPVGAMREQVIIVGIDPGRREDEFLIHLQFSRSIPGVEGLLRSLQLRRKRRQRIA